MEQTKAVIGHKTASRKHNDSEALQLFNTEPVIQIMLTACTPVCCFETLDEARLMFEFNLSYLLSTHELPS